MVFEIPEANRFFRQELTDNSWLQVDENSSWDVFPSTSFAEEGVEGVVTSPDGLIWGHLPIRLDTMFQTVEFPTSVSNLDASLANMNRNAFPLWKKVNYNSQSTYQLLFLIEVISSSAFYNWILLVFIINENHRENYYKIESWLINHKIMKTTIRSNQWLTEWKTFPTKVVWSMNRNYFS